MESSRRCGSRRNPKSMPLAIARAVDVNAINRSFRATPVPASGARTRSDRTASRLRTAACSQYRSDSASPVARESTRSRALWISAANCAAAASSCGAGSIAPASACFKVVWIASSCVSNAVSGPSPSAGRAAHTSRARRRASDTPAVFARSGWATGCVQSRSALASVIRCAARLPLSTDET